ncbi:MAG: protein kinase [bacterium]|nr:protein kinase [bacterium]
MNIGRYEIRRQLGQGGMGQVLLGYDPSLQREAAIKIMQAGIHSSEDLQRFQREALTISKLNHPGIVTLYEMGQDQGRLFLAMELVEGISFSELVQPGQVPNLAVMRRNLALLRQVFEAIAFAHERGVVHRDLKPDNLMVTSGGQAKVLDFGLAFMAGQHNLTVTGDVGMGTPSYVAPEQIKDFAHTDWRADIYSLGVILHQLVTGKCPFAAPNTVSLIYKVISESPLPPSRSNPLVNDKLDALVLRMLRKDPKDRYQSVRELLPLYDRACVDLNAGQASVKVADLPAADPVTSAGIFFPALGSGADVPSKNSDETCPHCGWKNRLGYKFCNNCGLANERRCPQCGNSANRSGASFCNSCGSPLLAAGKGGTPAKELLRGILDREEVTPQYTYLQWHRDYVKLGRYPQRDEADSSPIEWMVLHKNSRTRKMLLISRYGLDCGRYDCGSRAFVYSPDWSGCTLRRWLEEEFYPAAFSEEERKLIVLTKFGREDGFADGRRAGGGKSGSGSHVFLLSVAEAEEYFRDDLERCCRPTPYAVSEGAYSANTDEAFGWWWLRTAGTEEGCAACVHDGGAINDRGRSVGETDICIRPALYIKL